MNGAFCDQPFPNSKSKRDLPIPAGYMLIKWFGAFQTVFPRRFHLREFFVAPNRARFDSSIRVVTGRISA